MINEANLSAVRERDQKVSGSKVAAAGAAAGAASPRMRKREQTKGRREK